MARPAKQGLDYFPLDIHIDDKLKFIKAKFGWEGFGIVVGLFQHIYGHGYWCSWSGDDDFLYAAENRIERTLLLEIIEESLKRGLFSKELYKKHQILTSRGIQKRYAEIIKRRKKVDIVLEYVLIGHVLCKHDANMMQTESEHDVNKSTQRKEKGKRKEREIEREEPKPAASNPKIQTIFQTMKEKLAMADQEINSVYTTCSNPEKLAEAVQCALEFDQDLRAGQEKAISDPAAYIRKTYSSGKQSGKTRLKSGNNKPAAKKEERTFAEVFAATIYHKDGSITIKEE